MRRQLRSFLPVAGRRLLPVAVILVSLAAAAYGQTPPWVAFAPGDVHDSLQTALLEYDRLAAADADARHARSERLHQIAAEARDLAWDYDTCLEALVGLSDESGAQAVALAALRRRVGEAVVSGLPMPGTPFYRGAEEWLLATMRVGLGPTGEVVAFVEELASEAIPGADESALSRFRTELAAAGDLPDVVAPAEGARIALAVWWIEWLAAEEASRVPLLRRLRLAAGRLGSGPGSRAAAVEAAWDGARLREASYRVDDEVAAGLSARAVGSGGAFLPADDRARLGIGAFLSAISAADPSELALLASVDPDLRFVLDRLEPLLAAASDLQRYRFAAAFGLSAEVPDRLRHALYAARAVLAVRERPHLTIPEAGRAHGDYLQEGTSYVAAAARWVEEGRSRASAEFRWSMLPAIGHPYAQHLLASDPALEGTRSLVEQFVQGIYHEVSRVAAAVGGVPSPGGSLLPFDRVIIAPTPEAAETVYRAFAAAAQGQAILHESFSEEYAFGLSLAGYWSHGYGLHVASSAGEEPPFGRTGERAATWMRLAMRADTVSESFSHLIRGFIALSRFLDEQLGGVLAAAGVRSLALVSPRLAAARELIDGVASFRVQADVGAELLASLFGSTGRGAQAAVALVDLLAAECAHVVDRLGAGQAADRNLLAALARSVR